MSNADNREMKISVELMEMWLREGSEYREFTDSDKQTLKVRVARGIPREAHIVGAHITYDPYPLLVLEYDQAIPDDVSFQAVYE